MTTKSEGSPSPDAPKHQPEKEIKPGLWKLLAAAGGILVVVFLAMELVDDTYTGSMRSTVSTPPFHDTGAAGQG